MKFFKSVAVSAISTCVLISASYGSQINITFPLHVAPKNARTVMLKDYVDQVSKFSAGRIKVTLYPGDQLYNTASGLRALTQGSVQMMEAPNGAYLAYDKIFNLIEIPFVFNNSQKYYNFLYGTPGEKILKSLEKSNMHGITFADEGPMIIATKDRLLAIPSDFKGLVVRTSGHKLVEDSLRRLGASTTKMSLSEVYSAAQQNVINAVYTTISAYKAQHLNEVMPYVTLWPGRGAYVWVMSDKLWNSLDAYDRHMITTTAKQAALEYNYHAWHNKDKDIAELSKKGVKYHELTESELKTIHSKIMPLYNDLKKKFGAEIINSIVSGK